MVFIFNQLVKPYPELRMALARQAGRRIALSMSPFSIKGVITQKGWLAVSKGEPEATISLNAQAMVCIINHQTPALSDIQKTGDMVLAGELLQIIGQCQWDTTELLSQVIGDAAAYRLEKGLRALWNHPYALAKRLLENRLDQHQEILAPRVCVTDFIEQADTLRDDFERLDKRLARLEKQCLLSLPQSGRSDENR